MDIQNNPTPEEVWRAFKAVGSIVTGRPLAVTVDTTETAVKHYLGRVPEYWFELAPADGAALVKETTTARTSTHVYLIASTAVSSTIWIW